MKKEVLNKYILFAFVSFLSFLGNCYARNTITPGAVYYIDNHKYENISCQVGNVGNGEYEEPLVLEKISSGYKVVYARGTDPNRLSQIVCTYTEDGIGNNKEESTIVFDFQTINTELENINLAGGASGIEENVFSLTGATKVLDVKITGGSEYIEFVEGAGCPAEYPKCVLRPTAEGLSVASSGRDIAADLQITYETKYGQELTTTFTVYIDAYSGARAYPGGVGVCEFDSNWKYRTYYSDSGAQKYSYYQGADGVKLPNCTPTNSILEVEFKGWISGLANDNTSIVQAIGGCSGAVKAGEVASSNDVYYACYESEPTVQLAIGTGNIENISDWKYSEGRGYYYIGSGDKAVLPGVKFVGSFDQGKTLKGWMNNGVIKQPGDTVDLDGKVWTALIETTTYYEPNRYNKKVYVGDSTELVVEGITGCSVATGGSYIAANYSSGVCLVSGISATPDGTTADINVQAGSNTYTFKFSVVSLAGESQNGGEDFIIDTSTNVNYNVENVSYEKDGLIFDIPDTFLIKKSDGYKINERIGSSFNYFAIWPENGVDVEHLTFCLDPGLTGPGAGTMYKKDELQYTGDFDKLISYLGEVVIANEPDFQNPNNVYRVAATVVVRLVAFKNNIDNGTNGRPGGELRRHYNSYRNAANALNALGGHYEEAAIRKILSENMEIDDSIVLAHNGSNVKLSDVIVDMLMTYSTHEAKGMGTDFSREITSKESRPITDNSYQIHYTGTITLPDGATTIPTIDTTECNANSASTGVKCVSASISGNAFDVIIEVDASKVKVPKSAEERKKMSVKVTVGGGATVKNIYLASPAKSGETKQRMIIFDFTGNGASAYMYLDVFPDKERCKDIASLNPANCISPTACSINKELFQETGCCDEVTDTVTYAYLLQSACGNGCTTTTFESVCSYSPGNEDKSQLYEIKEGTIYNGSSYLNNIGNCVVNVSDKYNTSTSSSFNRTDDKGNSINVSAYDNNRYCTVTCKEDWKISMDSFGNYVGTRSVAAGTWFRVDNDIFIGGERTCYTNFLNYDQYMNDLVKTSDDIVKAYNKYSNNSHAYTDFERMDDSTRVSATPKTECAVWKSHPDGYSNDDYKSDGDDAGKFVKELQVVEDGYKCTSSIDGNPTSDNKCVHDKPASGICESGYTVNSSGKCQKDAVKKYKCPDGDDNPYYNYPDADGKTSKVTPTGPSDNTDSSAKCKYAVSLQCKTEGTYFSYSLKTKDDVDGGTYSKYSTSVKNQVADVFGSGVYIPVENQASSARTSYTRTEQYNCSYEANKGPEGIAEVKCSYGTGFEGNNPIEDRGGPSSGSDTKTFCNNILSENDYFCKKDDTANKGKAFIKLKDSGMEATKNAAGQAQTSLSLLYTKVKDYASDFFKCQNFYLYNTSDTRSYNKKTGATYTALGNNVDPVQITTKFEPNVAYTYDEPEYMTILGKDNILVPNDEKNESIIPNYNTDANNAEESANVDFFTKDLPPSSVEVKLQRNKTETKYYNDATPWQEGTNQYNNYEGSSPTTESDFTVKQVVFCTAGLGSGDYASKGQNDNPGTPYVGVTKPNNHYWVEGQCYTVKVRYRSAHYISSYIGNSSFYRNKGNWYQRGNDIKEHGDDFANALANANTRSPANKYNVAEEKPYWSRLAFPFTNIFPISLDTPRNLYQYTYSFNGIGSDSTGNQLGRLMGGDNPIIKLNARSCFYEVHEELCLCCGSEISTYVEDSTDTIKEFLNENPFSYDLTDENKVNSNRDGILNIKSSSFGLNDVASKYGTNREVPTNWSTSSPFYYNGVNYFTEKGDVALREIEAKGENIYAETPEYSYFLTPASLTAIRDYNASNGYEIRMDKLNVYGVYSISCPSASNCNVENPDIESSITFRHYGSKFLEEFMYDINAVQSGTLASSSNKTICTVNKSVGEKDIANMVKTQNCRWIDYIQEPISNDSKAENTYFRLAFK